MTTASAFADEFTGVGPATLTGDLVRQYWIPFYPSEKLRPGGEVFRVRLLGEDLVVFRSPQGRVGLLAANCAHRGAPMFYARNEDCGLRCVYHGWAYDLAGQCRDMPNEPPASKFKDRISIAGYPCEERNGLVWAYMGPLEAPPPLPALEWNSVPSEQLDLTFRVQECHFQRPIEGEYDSSHVLFLHGGLPGTTTPAPGTFREAVVRYRRNNPHPRFQALETEYGVLVGACYEAEPDTYYWRIYPFMMPFYTVINVDPTYITDTLLSGHAWVPMDDGHTLVIGFTWHPDRPLTDEERHVLRHGQRGVEGIEGLHPTEASFEPRLDEPFADWWPKHRRSNNFGFDPAAQERGDRYSGIPGLWQQDAAVQEGYGPVPNLAAEHLGTADLGQVVIRRRLRRAAKALRQNGVTPPGVDRPEIFSLRPAEVVLPRDVTNWQDAIDAALRAR
jgi:phthalate 4,5-dioxygenase oxygenase subunit